MVMKLATFLMIITLLQVNANGFSQISLDRKGVSLETVFKQIERQSDYVFFSKDFDARNIDIHVKDVPIETALDACFKGLPFSYKIIGKTIVVRKEDHSATQSDVVAAQEIVIGGKVTDQKGEPLPGVAVRLKGTALGTVTDAEGHYSISVPDGTAVLVFSFIGFASQEVTVGNAVTVDIRLVEETATLYLGEIYPISQMFSAGVNLKF